MKEIKYIFISFLVGIIAFPAITLGGTFVSSLIQGKTIEEATQILAEQIDVLIGRVRILETQQTELDAKQREQERKLLEQERADACRFADTALTTAQIQGGIIDADIKSFEELIFKIVFKRDNSSDEQYIMWQSRLEKVQALKEQYLSAKTECEEKQLEQEQIAQELEQQFVEQEQANQQLQEQLTRERACKKRDELLYPPADWLEKHGGTVGGTTERQIDFLQNILEEGEKLTGKQFLNSTYFGKHTLEEVRSAVDEIKERWQEYLKYKEICEAQ